MTIVDNAIYVAGARVASPKTLDETFELLRRGDAMAWIGLYRPDPAELHAVASEFDLHPLAIEDALKGHQRPKLERFGDTLFVVLRPGRYIDADEVVEFGEVHLFIGPQFVVTVRHAENPDIGRVRRRLESSPELLALGPDAVLYAVLDEVVDAYAPVVAGLENDIDEIEDQLFGGDQSVSRRIYELHREVISFQRATAPLSGMLDALLRGADKYDLHIEVQRSLRDVHDHVIRLTERADAFRALLENALTVHSTLVTQQQNDEMRRLSEASLAQNEETRRLSETALAQNEGVKKISAWAAILFAPTLIGTIYGMNFEHMPELAWPIGYPLALLGMVAGSVILYTVFKRRHWL
ncbi:magnesium and cobalt transport protein CorA [Salinibacterium sp. dk2585]|uniref:magnesium and cobalt transport protein CorA n=1 Tax=unclassified Salinibacterium TaxID=2632331 RepID=UPI0011C24BB9|nr:MULTISPECIES: magnesium and cobalt transport protein CorA [unclassified Salinibacterium]QEE60289.1 magnesium and cobalt transport protein CorA [Salinibacterium sp. dk2585]TXK55361.1 magnesium and cobalt transport protein CorA [Salinibacterium sp. dk5596]